MHSIGRAQRNAEKRKSAGWKWYSKKSDVTNKDSQLYQLYQDGGSSSRNEGEKEGENERHQQHRCLGNRDCLIEDKDHQPQQQQQRKKKKKKKDATATQELGQQYEEHTMVAERCK